MTLALTLPIWVLEVVAFAALSLIWLAGLLCIADAVGGWLKRRSERRTLDRLWDDTVDENPHYGPGNPDWERDFERDRVYDEPPGAGADPFGRPDPRTHPEFWTE